MGSAAGLAAWSCMYLKVKDELQECHACSYAVQIGPYVDCAILESLSLH